MNPPLDLRTLMNLPVDIRTRARPYTAEQQLPYTSDPRAHRAIENIFCCGQVERDEACPGLTGWVICFQRPLSIWQPADSPEPIVGYGEIGTVFRSYREALAVSVRTLEYAESHGFNWFLHEKHRIFPVGTGAQQDFLAELHSWVCVNKERA